MYFRNFVGSAKEVSFLPKEPREVSYGAGSPSVSVNNQEVDAQMIQPLSTVKPTKSLESAKHVNVEGTTQLVENIVDSDDPLSED